MKPVTIVTVGRHLWHNYSIQYVWSEDRITGLAYGIQLQKIVPPTWKDSEKAKLNVWIEIERVQEFVPYLSWPTTNYTGDFFLFIYLFF